MKRYSFNEHLLGIVDGVNKTFTTINTISDLEEVYVGGTPYRDISFINNIITFNDAPPIGETDISADYFYEDGITPPSTGGLVFGELIGGTEDYTDGVYDTIGHKRLSNIYKINTIKDKINKAIIKLSNKKVFNLDTEYMGLNIVERQLSAVGYNASYVEVGVYDYIPTSGYAMINGHIFKYNSYIDGKLNGAVGVVYNSGERVEILYGLPNKVKAIKNVTYYDNDVAYYDYKIEGALYVRILSNGLEMIQIAYQANKTIYENDDDIVDFPYEYSNVIVLYVAYNLLMNREDERYVAIKEAYKEEERQYKGYLSRSNAKPHIRSNALTGI